MDFWIVDFFELDHVVFYIYVSSFAVTGGFMSLYCFRIKQCVGDKYAPDCRIWEMLIDTRDAKLLLMRKVDRKALA